MAVHITLPLTFVLFHQVTGPLRRLKMEPVKVPILAEKVPFQLLRQVPVILLELALDLLSRLWKKEVVPAEPKLVPKLERQI